MIVGEKIDEGAVCGIGTAYCRECNRRQKGLLRIAATFHGAGRGVLSILTLETNTRDFFAPDRYIAV